jgi:hypothetical protein
MLRQVKQQQHQLLQLASAAFDPLPIDVGSDYYNELSLNEIVTRTIGSGI